MTPTRYEVAVIGAGPYGLSTGAFLRSAGFAVRVFGAPMEFWQCHMPAGMRLRSPWNASHIAGPCSGLTLDAYERAHAIRLSDERVVPLEGFVDYGLWFQATAIPDLDRRQVARVEPLGSGFQLRLEDGEPVHAQRVVVATGIGSFAWYPPPFRAVPRSLASHSSDHANLAGFCGRRVAVIGAGQSALESAALLHENGANVEVLVRGPRVRWRRRWFNSRYTKVVAKLVYAPSQVGPAGLCWLTELPGVFRRLPASLQQRVATIAMRPEADYQLCRRLKGVLIRSRHIVRVASPVGDRVRLELDDGSVSVVDHVLLATGYRVRVAECAFLSREVLRGLRLIDGYPDLNESFQASMPGLYFVGATAAHSFGPLMRFVAGTGYTARAVTRSVKAESAKRGSSPA